MVDRDDAIAEFPVLSCASPPPEQSSSARALAALLFADGSGDRAGGAIRAGRSQEDQREIVLPPDQVSSLERLLGGIDACTRCGSAVIAGVPISCSINHLRCGRLGQW